MRSVENLPEEAAELAEAAATLIKMSPETRRAFGELASMLLASVGVSAGMAIGGSAGSTVALSSIPVVVTVLRKLLGDTVSVRRNMALPVSEQKLWEDAGAVFEQSAVEENAVSAATAFAQLIFESAEGDTAVASILGVDKSRISQRVRERSLYAFTLDDVRYFPRWQFTTQGTLSGLRTVVSALDASLHPLVVDHWFTTPSVDLEVKDEPASPVTWLLTGGDPEAAAELAADL